MRKQREKEEQQLLNPFLGAYCHGGTQEVLVVLKEVRSCLAKEMMKVNESLQSTFPNVLTLLCLIHPYPDEIQPMKFLNMIKLDGHSYLGGFWICAMLDKPCHLSKD